MAVTYIKNLGDAPILIAGQLDIVICDAPSEYSSSTTLADVLSNPTSVGQVVQDSTSWDGDEVSFDNLLDEQGDIITSTASAGTNQISFDLVDFEPSFLTTFLKAESVTVDSTGLTALINGTPVAYGFGHKLPVVTRPLFIINDEGNRALFFPKMKIAAGLDWSDKIWKIHCIGSAESVDTDYLKTAMVLTGGSFLYS